MKAKSKTFKRSITTSKSKRKIKKALKSVGVIDYSLKEVSKGKIKITLKSNLETCRRILQILGE